MEQVQHLKNCHVTIIKNNKAGMRLNDQEKTTEDESMWQELWFFQLITK